MKVPDSVQVNEPYDRLLVQKEQRKCLKLFTQYQTRSLQTAGFFVRLSLLCVTFYEFINFNLMDYLDNHGI